MRLEKTVKVISSKEAYGIISIRGELLPDAFGRILYTTKRKAQIVAEQWGLPKSNVVSVTIKVNL